MIKSIKEIDWNTEFKVIHFDDRGVILSIDNRISEEPGVQHAYFEIKDIMGLVVGTERLRDYKVFYDSKTLDHHLKKLTSEEYKSNNLTTYVKKIERTDNPEVIVKIVDDGITIRATDLLRDYFVPDASEKVKIGGKLDHRFYITLKDEPEFIIEDLKIKFSEILTGKEIHINYEHKYDISVYTRYVFSTYSLGD